MRGLILALSFVFVGLGGLLEPCSAQLHDRYGDFKEKSVGHRRIKHADIVPLVRDRGAHGIFRSKIVGRSVMGRDIYMNSCGTGQGKVLLFSQMHGDEPTATQALMDLMNFMEASGDGFDEMRRSILSNLTLDIVPMINPDGAELFRRQSATGIDMNQDGRKMALPESKTLYRLGDSIKPNFVFTLHDQNIHHTAASDTLPASIAFLAPAYEKKRIVNDVRQRAMQVIVVINSMLQKYIPGQVSTYNDTYSPRGFGDKLTGMGASTILIEAGGRHGDIEKQELRRLVFLSLVTGLEAIAKDSYQSCDIKQYKSIPINSRKGMLADLIIGNLNLSLNGYNYTTNVVVDRVEVDNPTHTTYYPKGHVSMIGDILALRGYYEIDATGLSAVAGKVSEQVYDSIAQLTAATVDSLMGQGVGYIRVRGEVSPFMAKDLPFGVVTPDFIATHPQDSSIEIDLGSDPLFFLKNSEGRYCYLISKGQSFRVK